MRSSRSASRRMWRRLTLWIVCTIFLLVAIAAILINTDPVQQFVLRRAEDFARAAGYSFTAKHLGFDPFNLEFSLSGFLYDNRGVRVEVDELTVGVPWNIYNADGIVLNSLSADVVRIVITSPEPILPEPSGKTVRLPRIVVDRLSLQNASFSYSLR